MDDEEDIGVLDPVCGMTVSLDRAQREGLTTDHGGRTWAFCWAGCRRTFLAAPSGYVARATAAEAAHAIGPTVIVSHATRPARRPLATDEDPVCGMTVDPEVAGRGGLAFMHEGTTYAFCGPRCREEFASDPEPFLDPEYVTTR